jgi:hypothetical protein
MAGGELKCYRVGAIYRQTKGQSQMLPWSHSGSLIREYSPLLHGWELVRWIASPMSDRMNATFKLLIEASLIEWIIRSPAWKIRNLIKAGLGLP